MWWRRFRLGLPTVLGLRPLGFFIPYRYAASLTPYGQVMAYEPLAEIFAAHEEAFQDLLGAVDGLGDALRAIKGGPPPAPRFDQDWFPTLDAAAAYAMVRSRRPARIVEIGSGHSTRFLARAIADGGLKTELTSIDPAPRAAIAGLPIRVVKATLGEAGTRPFEALAAGDMVSIDSSHILMPGSDVDDVMNRILPRLPAGSLVHFHDMFLPDPYPRAWAWRGYNEQNAVAAMLAAGGYKLLFASHYAKTRMQARLAASVVADLPARSGAWPNSLWLEKS